jgi:peptidyl-prolyl cis-trans isomerase A (cyclophilin A)
MTSLRTLLLTAALIVPIAACGGGEGEGDKEPAAAPAAKEPKATPAPMKAPGAEAKPGVTSAADPLAEARTKYNPALLDPSKATETAPATYAVKLETTKGDMIIDVTREWAPNGADRFYNLVKIGYYDDVAFFRVMSGFMAQVGIHGDPKVNQVWREARIQDEPVKASNTPGMVTFAMGGPNSRTTQIFLNLGNNANLDPMKFAPFGKLRSMDVLTQIHSGYGEGAPRGRGPMQGKVQSEGNAYLRAQFPELDYIKKATILTE